MGFEKESFGKAPSNEAVDLYTLTNANDMVAKVTNYGGTLVSLQVPDKNGKFDDIVLGFNSLDDYIKDSPYFGCITGRFANRIAKGRFELDGKTYQLAQNNDENHLHGGIKGFDKVVWEAEPYETDQEVGLRFHRVSPDGEEGYPGTLDTSVVYILTRQDEFRINYRATTDRATIVNLTHHTYFNLGGEGNGDVCGHEMMINAGRYTSVGENLIPDGKLPMVQGTPLDFTESHTIGERIGDVPGGYDHNYVINRRGDGICLAARVVEPQSGRVMEVYTTEPGMQFYSGNFLDGTLRGKSGKAYGKHYGFCLETQHFPDSPNQPDFPSVVLRPGEVYKQEVLYKFSVKA